MKKHLLIISASFLFIIGAHVEHASAQDKDYIGIGAIIGDPTGLSIKGWVDEDIAIDGALSFDLRDNYSSLYLHSDVLFHNDEVDRKLGLGQSNFNVYYGAGLRFILRDNVDDTVGLRFPGGFTYGFDNTPLVMFFELAPVLDVSPDAAFGFDGAIGARFYLN